MANLTQLIITSDAIWQRFRFKSLQMIHMTAKTIRNKNFIGLIKRLVDKKFNLSR